MRTNKKLLGLLFSLAAAVLTLLGGCQSEASNSSVTTHSDRSGEPVTIKVAVDAAAFGLPFRVAIDQGYFQKYGIDVQLSTHAFGIDTLNAVITKQAEVGQAMDFALLTRLDSGQLKVVAAIASPTSKNSRLVVRDGIQKPEDLKGKKLGVQRGTVQEYIWAKYLEKYSIKPDEVELLPMTSVSELLTAFTKGDISAFWVNKTFANDALQVPGALELADLTDINFRMVGFMAVDKTLLESNELVVQNLLKGLEEANQSIKQNPEHAAEVAFRELKLPKEDVLSEITYDYEFEVRFDQNDFDQLKSIHDWALANGLLEKEVNLEEAIEIGPISEAFPDRVTYHN